MTLMARMFGESDASRIVQLQIEADIPPTNGEILPLTQLERLEYFRKKFRKFQSDLFKFHVFKLIILETKKPYQRIKKL